MDDVDLNLADFVARVNSDVVGKFVNLASRCAGFIEKRFNGQLAVSLPDTAVHALWSAIRLCAMRMNATKPPAHCG